MIPEELVQKSWTACRYPAKADLACSNEELVVMFSDEEMGTMVKKLCGPGVCSKFDNKDLCGPDPSFPGDEDCRSDDSNDSDDDSVQAIQPTATVGCAAGEHYRMKTTHLDGHHKCLNCRELMHVNVCGALWDEKGPAFGATLEDLTKRVRNSIIQWCSMIRYTCMK